MWANLRHLLFKSWLPRQHVTRTGLAYTIALLLVGIAAFLSANNLLFLVLAAMIANFLVSGFVSRLGLAGLELDLVLPEHLAARQETRAGVRVRNLKRLMPSFSIHLAGVGESGFNSKVYFPVLPGGAMIEESIEVCFAHRGSQKERSFQFSTRFPFGFAERREQVTLRHEIVIYPCLDPQPGFEELLLAVTGDLESGQKGRGSDFYRIRPYEALESARHVDWKATAHTGDLQVREFAEEKDQRVTIVLDLDVAHEGMAWFETAVEAVAFLAFRLSRRGVPLRFRSQSADLSLPDESDIYTILRYLALVSPIEGASGVTPDETDSFDVVFTYRADRALRQGWGGRDHSRIVGPFDIAARVPDPSPSPDLHNRVARNAVPSRRSPADRARGDQDRANQGVDQRHRTDRR